MPEDASSLARERRALIVRRLPPFAAGWTAVLALWLGVFAFDGRLAPAALGAAALAVLALAAVVLIARAHPTTARIVPLVVATCIALGLAAMAVVAAAGAYGEILAFMLLTLYLAAALLFCWGWRAELVLLAGTLLPWALVLRRFPLFVSPLELTAAVTIGSGIALAIAELSARELQQVVRRRRAQESLRASEERFRSSFAHASIGMVVVGLDGTAVEVNPAFAMMLGYAPEEIVGRRMDALAHPDDVAAATAATVQLLRGEVRAFEMTKRYLHRDGGVVWGLLDCSLTRDADGRPQALIAQVQDVSERKAAEEALRASEARYRGLVESQQELIVRLDPEGRFTFVNGAYAAAFGRTPADLLGRSFLDLVHPDDHGRVAEAMAGMAHPPHRTCLELRNLMASGVRWVAWEGGVVVDDAGRPVEAQAVGRDVTERRQAEERLRESEERFRSAFDDAAIGMALTTVDGRTLRANRALCEMLGYSEAALLGAAMEDVVHPDDRACVDADQTLLAEGPLQSYRAVRRYRHRAGRMIWVQVAVSVVRDAAGAPQYFLAQIQDITERHEAEAALQQSLADLRQSEEKLRLLARRQVAIREEERKRLGFDLHDDVCQELAGIGILVESVRWKLPPMTAEHSAEFDRITGYLGRVVEHLRLLARDMRPALLQEFGLDGSLRSLAAGMATPDLAIVTHLHPVPRFDEDAEVSVYRIGQEALANAVRHAAARAIVLALAVRDGTLVLEVRDDGYGFDPASRPAACLGLASMEERAIALGGRLEIRSAPGKGTVVALRCPLPTRAVARVRALAAGPSPTRSSARPSRATTPRSVARD